MNYRTIILTTITGAILFSAGSCRKKNDPIVTPQPSATGEFGIELTNYVGDSMLALNTGNYTNGSGNTFTVTKFNYYISNITFKRTDGTVYAEPESYHLVQAEKGSSRHFHIDEVPAGNYVAISFTIGVDSAHNVAGAQTGALDPANSMFWDWNSGYIMAKLEGKSAQTGTADSLFRFHIGGFTGTNSALHTVTLTFPYTIVLKGGAESTIPMKADILKWFAPNVIDLATTNNIMMPGANSKKIADNYAGMFSLLPFPVE